MTLNFKAGAFHKSLEILMTINNEKFVIIKDFIFRKPFKVSHNSCVIIGIISYFIQEINSLNIKFITFFSLTYSL